jgi:hypothetical protein
MGPTSSEKHSGAPGARALILSALATSVGINLALTVLLVRFYTLPTMERKFIPYVNGFIYYEGYLYFANLQVTFLSHYIFIQTSRFFIHL